MKKINLNFFIIILCVSIFFRFHLINYQDFWWDELVTFFNSEYNISINQTYDRIHSYTIGAKADYDFAENANFFIYIYKYLFYFLGYSTESARYVSGLFGIFVVLYSVLIYNKFFQKNSIIFGFLICLNYYLITQSQEYRHNIFFCFIVLVNLFYFFSILNKKETYKKYDLFFYLISLLLTIWTNVFGFIIFFSQGFFLLTSNFITFKKLFFRYLLVFAIYCAINIRQLYNFTTIKTFHTTGVTYEFFFDYYFKYFFGSRISGSILLFIFVLSFVLVIKNKIYKKKEIYYLLILIFFSYFIPLIYSLIKPPILQPRYIIYLVPLILMLICYVFSTIKSRIANYCLLFLVFLNFGNTSYSLYYLKKNDKPHIKEVLFEIYYKEKDKSNQIHVLSSNIYLLNYLNNNNHLKKLNFRFTDCKNALNLKSYWQIQIFPWDRFVSCDNNLLPSDGVEKKYASAIKINKNSIKTKNSF